jgi:aminoglycoside-2''-adenylyltransferase
MPMVNGMPRPLDRLDRGSPPQDARRRRRHRHALALLTQAGVPFLVGGGYALRHYTGDVRGTKDLDVFVRRREARALLETLSTAGLQTDLTFPHWLGKARIEDDWIDVIYSSGNGLADVDDAWFTNAVHANVLGVPVRLCPPEEMIWSKAFVMERERYDGADISHLIRACHGRLDWGRLVARFGPHWRVLLSHLVLFGFIYPGERGCVPSAIMAGLCQRLERESRQPPSRQRLCQGTLLSREQYLTDVSRWGYADGRLEPNGPMTAEAVANWTAAIESEEERGDAGRGGR